MARVLVTGASGLVGRQVLAALARDGFDIHAAARRVPPPSLGRLPGTTWHQADLLDEASRHALVARVGAELLLHLAWYTDPADIYGSAENDRWVDASFDLVAKFRAGGGRRAVLAGSGAEYDWGPSGAGAGPCRETGTPLAPATRYGRAKDMLRRRLETGGAGLTGLSWAGLSWAWARLFHLYGPGEHERRLVPSIISALKSGEPALCTAGTQRRDYMDTRDAGTALVALAGADVEGAINLGSGVTVSVAELATELGRVAGRPELIRLGALPMRPGDPPLLVPDTQRLREAVGFRARYGLAEGLAHAWDWWTKR